MDNKLRLTQRELDEIRLALVYRRDFGHGHPGHLPLILIAKLADNMGFSINGETGKLETPSHVEIEAEPRYAGGDLRDIVVGNGD
jgi:hypothetical protein